MSEYIVKGRDIVDFFYAQESLTAIQWILRAVVAFFFLLIAAKLMGQRSISQLRLLDFAMAITVGNIIAHPLSDEGLEMRGSMITMSVLIVLYILSVFLSLKWFSFKKLVDPTPTLLIKNGQILPQNLAKARISVDFLLSELRKEKIEDVKKVILAFFEPDGSITSFLYPEYQAVTRADLPIKTTEFFMPPILIKEGKINYDELNKLQMKEELLIEKVKASYNTDIKNVLLATMDQNNNLNVFLSK